MILKNFSFICIKGNTWRITFTTSISFCLLTLWLSNRFQHCNSPHRLISTHVIWTIYSLRSDMWILLSFLFLYNIYLPKKEDKVENPHYIFLSLCSFSDTQKILLVRHPCLSCKSNYAKQQKCKCCVDFPTIPSYFN